MVNFSFMCDSDFKYKATPAYDLTFARKNRQLSINYHYMVKLFQKIDIDDITTLATEFSIDLKFVAASLEKMKNLRDKDLPQLRKIMK